MPPKRKADNLEATKSSIKTKKKPASSKDDKEVADAQVSNTKESAILTGVAPLTQVGDMFFDMASRVPSPSQKTVILRVATVCSGTDAPIIALEALMKAVEILGHPTPFQLVHQFSCEIEAFKQGFIRRNLPAPTIIYRDVADLALAASKLDGKV